MKKFLVALCISVLAASAHASKLDFYSAFNSDNTIGGFKTDLGIDNLQLAFNFGFTTSDDDTDTKESTGIGLSGIPAPIIGDLQVNVNFGDDTSGDFGFEGLNIERHVLYEVVPNLELGVLIDLIRYTTDDFNASGDSSFSILAGAYPIIQVRLFEL